MGDRVLHVISDNNADFDHRFKLPSMQIEGYEMNLPQIVGNLYTIDYVNSKSGDLITVTGRIKEDNLSLRIDNESEYHITTIQNRDAFYLSKDEVSIFMFEDDFCIYVITGSFDLDLGTELAKSFM